MVFRILRYAAWPALLAAGISTGCNSPPTPADTYVSSYLQAVSATAADCPFGIRQQWVDIGVGTGNSPSTVPDQGSQAGGQVTVACTVHPDGSGFDIQLNASQSNVGSMTITSQSPIDPSAGGTGVIGTFESGAHDTWRSNNCTLTFAYNNGKVPVSPPIAAGRIWAHVSCPNVSASDLNFQAPDGGTVPSSCDGEADFLFENCAD
jgi:hypothetical protein